LAGTAADCGAFSEAVVFLDYFKDFPDPRQPRKGLYRLDEVLLLCRLCSPGRRRSPTSPGSARRSANGCAGSARFAMGRRRTITSAIFSSLDAEAFQRCFLAWVAALTGARGDVIAIDGKTARRSDQKKGAKEPIHMVSAFAARQRRVLGQGSGKSPMRSSRSQSCST
jgi:hypothetical protein